VIEELAVAHVLLAAFALISCLSVPEKRTIRLLPRAAWVGVIVLAPLAGSIGWFLAGRPHRIGPPADHWRSQLGMPRAVRPPAPEDDLEFLRSLDQPSPGQPREQPRPGQPREQPGPGQDSGGQRDPD